MRSRTSSLLVLLACLSACSEGGSGSDQPVVTAPSGPATSRPQVGSTGGAPEGGDAPSPSGSGPTSGGVAPPPGPAVTPSEAGTGSAGAPPAVGGAPASPAPSASGGAGGAPAGGAGGPSGAGGQTPLGVAGAAGAAGVAGAVDGGGAAVPCEVDYGDEVPSLREVYADHFAIGAAIDTQYESFAGLLGKHFNSVTAEDQMKFDALQPSEGNFTYGTADQMVDYAVNNGMQVRGHALVWHRQTPSWVFSGSTEQVLQRMRNHIANVMQHFEGRVGVWDVVNEAILDDGSYRTGDEEEGQASGWYGALGESYIAEAFRAARAADPAAKLFYNDYYNYHPARRQAIYEMLAGLLEDGVPVDGVGLQCHLNLAPGTDPNEQSYHQTVENLEQAIELYASLGLDVQITELDLSVYLRGISYTPDQFYTPETFTPELKEQQAERYREFFALFRKHSDVISSVSLWGIADNNTWLSEFSSGRQDFPLLFDAQQQPKPAFWAVVDFCD